MSKWIKKHRTQIKSYLPDDLNCSFVGYDFLNHKTTSISTSEVLKYDLILGYDDYYDLYAAWDPYLHNKLRGNTHSFGTGKFLAKDINDFECIKSIYKPLNDGTGKYEKMVLIKPNFIKEFCQNCFCFLFPDPEEENYNDEVKYHLYNNIVESGERQNYRLRTNYTCRRVEREASFRKRVLDKYNHTCLVCGTNEDSILQAAHIVAVSDGGTDDTDNGYCLCANHHLLYDNNKIKINLELCTYSYIGKTNDPYMDCGKKRNFKLFIKN